MNTINREVFVGVMFIPFRGLLHSAITIKEGAPEHSNFHEYLPLRINEMPAIEVHIVPSREKPTGVGEPGTPVIAPAVANALAAATGERLRKLPLTLKT